MARPLRIYLRNIFWLIAFVMGSVFLNRPALAKTAWDDNKILSRLNAGEGAIVFHYVIFANKKEVDVNSISFDADLDTLIGQSMEKQKKSWLGWAGDLLYINSASSGKEKKAILIEEREFFLIMGQPGEYLVSRLTFPGYYGVGSHRLYWKINIEPGRIKYVGDLIGLGVRKAGTIKIAHDYKPEPFRKMMEQFYPQSEKFLVEEKTMSIENQGAEK